MLAWFVGYAKRWRLPTIELAHLTRKAYTLYHDMPCWAAIGHTWTFCVVNEIFDPYALSFFDFVVQELKKYGMRQTPFDFFRAQSIDMQKLAGYAMHRDRNRTASFRNVVCNHNT